MVTEDKKSFVEMVKKVCAVFGRDYTHDLGAAWWAVLQRYELLQVSGALNALMRQSKFFPKPAEIIELIEGQWHGADEAWALMPKDERDTAAVTPAMMTAWGVAAELYRGGDEIGARMAFKSAYSRAVSEARSRGESEVWQLSIGHDSDKREPAIRRAVDLKQITSEIARQYIADIPEKDGGVIAGLLTGKVKPEEVDEILQEKWHSISEMLKNKEQQSEGRKRQQTKSEREDFEKKRRDALQKLKKMQQRRRAFNSSPWQEIHGMRACA